jgi:hypothetical protein
MYIGAVTLDEYAPQIWGSCRTKQLIKFILRDKILFYYSCTHLVQNRKGI